MQSVHPYVYDITILETYCKSGFAIYRVDVLGVTRFSLNHNFPITYSIKLRYSDMLEFHQQISARILSQSKDAFLLEFPPKKYFNNLSQDFLEERKQKLQLYFTHILKYYKELLQPELIKFCSPNKINIVVCGTTKSGKSAFLSNLTQKIKSLHSKERYESPSYKAKKENELEPLYDSPLQLVSSKSVDVTKVFHYPAFLNKLNDFSCDFPIDYLYNDFLYRIDIEEHALKPDMTEDACTNLFGKWSENGVCVILTINLSNIASYLQGIQILNSYTKIISKKIKPIFVVVGVVMPGVKIEVPSEQVRDHLMKPPFNMYPTSYIEVQATNGEGVLKALHILIKAKDMKDSGC